MAHYRALDDFSLPQAIMIPHFRSDNTALLETMITAVMPYCGVIVLSNDPCFSQTFLSTLPLQEHFTLIQTKYDTPWIRDRSPLAVARGNEVYWYIPSIPNMKRPFDDKLFFRISKQKRGKFPIRGLSLGNLIVGDKGVTFSTSEILEHTHRPQRHQKRLGIRRWIIFDRFTHESTGHADLYIRVLSPSLIAVAWNLSSKEDRNKMQKLIYKIKRLHKQITVLKIPIRSKKEQYASLLNWIQLDTHIILPSYTLTRKTDKKKTKALLSKHGFTSRFIHSPTLKEGGSLHCLSASIFV